MVFVSGCVISLNKQTHAHTHLTVLLSFKSHIQQIHTFSMMDVLKVIDDCKVVDTHLIVLCSTCLPSRCCLSSFGFASSHTWLNHTGSHFGLIGTVSKLQPNLQDWDFVSKYLKKKKWGGGGLGSGTWHLWNWFMLMKSSVVFSPQLLWRAIENINRMKGTCDNIFGYKIILWM